MNKIKACFFDFDGTLRDFKTGKVNDSTLNAFKIMRDKGIKIFISTGRHPYNIENFRKYYDFDGYVLDNGSYIVLNDAVIMEKYIAKDEIEKVMEWQKLHPVQIEFHSKHVSYLNTDTETSRYMEANCASFEMNFKIADNKTILNTDIIQFSFHGTASEEKDLFKYCDTLKSERWIDDFTDINVKGTSKANGCRMLMELLGLNDDEVLSFGDGGNDISMLDNVGCGIVMGNASSEVKKHGKYITDDIDKNGVYNALKHFGAI